MSTSSEESSYSGADTSEKSSYSGVFTLENDFASEKDSFSKRKSVVHVPSEQKSYSQGRKNKKMKGSFCDDDIIISKSSICSSIHDDIAVEILSRLPVKTLFRFKCLCKRLRFLIMKDRQFIYLHLIQAKNLPRLFIVTRRSLSSDFKRYFLTADFLVNGGITKTTNMHIIREKLDLGMIIKPVNSLMCSHIGNVVRIYNVGTREITPWIKSPQRRILSFDNVFQFGFDPATKKHKVITMWEQGKKMRNDDCVCSIFTVEENKWRTIDREVPPLRCFKGNSIYVDGSIYWFCKHDSYNNMDNNVFFMMVFDVGSEKFRRIIIPSFISDQHRNESRFTTLLELDGRVAILYKISDFTVKLWILDDDYNK